VNHRHSRAIDMRLFGTVLVKIRNNYQYMRMIMQPKYEAEIDRRTKCFTDLLNSIRITEYDLTSADCAYI